MTDSELAKQAQKGDREAFLSLLHRYHTPLYKLAYRFAGSVERAEDLCQEILIRAYVQIRKYDAKRPFQPWLMRVASNVCLNWREGESRRHDRELPLDDDLAAHASEDVEREVFDRMERQELIDALAKLPTQVRLLVVMRFSLDLTFREISEQTGIKLPTVAFRIAKGVEALRSALTPNIEVREQ
ncbi:MAG: sigma-70 family RNA polymerase sigma factor [Fimbriimonas sp.]|nr:sigma-70 family RNA polymerase sigma factor [Fimbriimonas sp.]